MADERIQKLAHLLVNYSVAVQSEDRVLIDGDAAAESLVREVYASVLRAGGHPMVMARLGGLDELLYRHASDEQLRHVPEPLKLIMSTYDVRISLIAEENTRALSSIDPAKMVMRSQARTEIMQTFMRRSASGELRWTLTMFPTNACAQDAEMSLMEYEDFVYGACLPDLDDPIGYWRRFADWQQHIVDWLKGKDRVRITGPGTDLTLSIANRTFINCNGSHNMPDGEVFTGPVEDSVEGHVTFSYPAIHGGREVNGVRLRFEGGRVLEATADKNQDFLRKTLQTDQGAGRVGELAIGTSEGITRFTRQILFDEKIGGSFHLALGAGYPETGSQNQSAIHWDMICDLRDGGEIRVDDELLYRDGKFVIDF